MAFLEIPYAPAAAVSCADDMAPKLGVRAAAAARDCNAISISGVDDGSRSLVSVTSTTMLSDDDAAGRWLAGAAGAVLPTTAAEGASAAADDDSGRASGTGDPASETGVSGNVVALRRPA